MMFSENIRMALGSIRRSRLRSFFTMLGIIIGVVSVITIVSLGEGVKRQVVGQINQLGAHLITIRPGRLVNRDANGDITSVNLFSGFSASTLTEQDMVSIRANTSLETVVPLEMVSAVPEYNDQQFADGIVVATSNDLPRAVNQKIEFGTFFEADENERHVAVIGAGVAEKLFKEAVPIGKTVKIRGQDFIVRGVFEKFPENPTMPGTDFNNAVFVPLGAGKAVSSGALSIYEVLVKPKDMNAVSQVVNDLTVVLRSNHSGQTDFTVLKQEESLRATGTVVDLISRMIIGMAAVALFVGGIGIMNVMLASVSERRREIGIRKSIGATNGQIRSQFMIEAAVLSVWGTFVGVIISGIINLVLRITTDLQPVITWQPVIYTSAISIAIGIIFGVIPAVKAARKDPIDALRLS